jgi:hypothetical protein
MDEKLPNKPNISLNQGATFNNRLITDDIYHNKSHTQSRKSNIPNKSPEKLFSQLYHKSMMETRKPCGKKAFSNNNNNFGYLFPSINSQLVQIEFLLCILDIFPGGLWQKKINFPIDIISIFRFMLI